MSNRVQFSSLEHQCDSSQISSQSWIHGMLSSSWTSCSQGLALAILYAYWPLGLTRPILIPQGTPNAALGYKESWIDQPRMQFISPHPHLESTRLSSFLTSHSVDAVSSHSWTLSLLCHHSPCHLYLMLFSWLRKVLVRVRHQ